VFAAKRHLDDRALTRRYLAERGLEALDAGDEPLLRHLGQCAACHARYVDLQGAFDGAREAMIGRADAAFSADRLAEQRDRIMRRIEAQTAGPRVLPFPAAPAATAGASFPIMRRWIAAAAVAGLLIGLAAGRFIHLQADRTVSTQAALSSPSRTTPVMRAVNVAPAMDEDAFLAELDVASRAPRADELRAIYAFTIEAPREAVPVRVSTKKN